MRGSELSFLMLIPFLIATARADEGDGIGVLGMWQDTINSIHQLERAAGCLNVEASLDPSSQVLITDSLMKNLSCGKLTPENVLSFVAPGAFSEGRQVQAANWTSSGGLGQCWSLSLYQRRLFYLARFGVQGAKPDPQYGLDLARGTTVPPGCTVSSSCAEKPTPKQVFSLPYAGIFYSYSFPLDLQVGDRDFRSQIEAQQKRRFYSLSNLGMLFGSGERSETTNQDTMAEIQKNLGQGRMPLIVIRAKRTSQHVVLIKGIEQLPGGSFRLRVYDSNVPWRDNFLEYRKKQFYAPGIVRVLSNDSADSDDDDPVGVFLKDEDEMDELQKANYDYYSGLCKKLKNPASASSVSQKGVGK